MLETGADLYSKVREAKLKKDTRKKQKFSEFFRQRDHSWNDSRVSPYSNRTFNGLSAG